ncbi:MAG: polysaccharide biosynthesis C-terminal domain-containing protein [Chitinophagaceae bacterium]
MLFLYFIFFQVYFILHEYYTGCLFCRKGRLYVNLAGSVICLFLVLLLDFWLIPGYGIKGAAIASSIAYTVSAIYQVWKFSGFKRTVLQSILVMNKNDWMLTRTYLKTYSGNNESALAGKLVS